MAETVNSKKLSLNRRRLLQAGAASAAVAGAPSLSRPARAGAFTTSGSARPMRNAERTAQTAGANATDAEATRGVSPPLPNLSIIALNRMGYGPRVGDGAAFNALGATPAARMAAYVAQQLNPAALDETELNNRFAQANFVSLNLSANPDTYLATLWDWYVNNNAPGGTSSAIPRDELRRATFLRAMYAKAQLQEVLAEFWHDHFNVHINHSGFVRSTFPHFDMILRLHIFGNFRAMLEAVARSTSMLYYLDNYTSSSGGPNENFSRELFELHTLGAENYFGVMPQNSVPTDGNGVPEGYVDADVFEATRCFTGWSFSYGVDGDGDTGLFYYRPTWHDRFQKNVLGVFIPQDQNDLQDGLDVLDALASHPGTGRHIARKLCRRLISDDPPQSVIDAAAAVFTAQWQAADQLKQVYEIILLSAEFSSIWGEKTKRPFEIAASSLRAGAANFTPKMDDSDTSSFLSRYDDTGHFPFDWPSPDGFPDVREAWQRMTPRLMSWRFCAWLVDFRDSNDNYYMNVLGQTPSDVRSANALADYWIHRLLFRPMSAEDREEIVRFMAAGFNPDFDLNFDDKDTCDRLRSMVALILMSPDFLWR